MRRWIERAVVAALMVLGGALGYGYGPGPASTEPIESWTVSGAGNALAIPTLETPNAEPKKVPTYLLILRYWGTVWHRGGDSMSGGDGWVYSTETYDTLAQVQTRLKLNQGWPESGVVGLWKLGVPMTVEMKTVEHVRPRHVEEYTTRERVWTIK